MLGVSTLQRMQNAVEPFLTLQSIGALPVGLLIGTAGGILTLLFLDNRRFPAGLLVILAGLMLGLIFGTRLDWAEIRVGLYLPTILPFGWPSAPDFSFALVALVTRSILYPILIHATFGIVNDTFIYLRNHRKNSGG